MIMIRLSDSQIWLYVEGFIDSHQYGIHSMFYKYAWISGADYEDVIQDIRLHCFQVIRSLESQYEPFDLFNKEVTQLIRKRTYGRFRVNNWHKRGFIRKSDVLNIEKGSEGDSFISSGEYIDEECDFDIGICSTFNDQEPDAGDYESASQFATRFLDTLLLILPDIKQEAINNVLLANGDSGRITLTALGIEKGFERTTISRRVSTARAQLQNFCKMNGLSLNMPKDELLARLTELVAHYRQQNGMNNPEYNVVEHTIYDYLCPDDVEV